MNELPLRALVKSLDGETTGHKSFTGPLGKLLMQADTMPIVKFDPIPSEPLSVVPNELSTDQKYLFRMYEAVSIGTVSESLAVRDPGNVCHSRWLTTANRFLRLYVSTATPSENLKTIVQYIMKCYAPAWLFMKFHKSIVHGSRNMYGLVKRCQALDEESKRIV